MMGQQEELNPEKANYYKMFDVPLHSLPVNRAQSSLSLQMCLYFDACFQPIWIITTIYHLFSRAEHVKPIWLISFSAGTALFILINPGKT